MTVYKQKPESTNWSYRFQFQGKRYGGICYGARNRSDAEAFETQVKASVMRLGQQQTLNDLYENCKDMIIAKKPIYLDKAYDKAMEKPRRRMPCEERENFKRNYWNDFLFFMRRMYPEITVMQKVTREHAEHYIALLRKNGNFKDFFNRKAKGQYSNYTANAVHNAIEQVFQLLLHDAGMPENPFSHIEKLPSDSDSHEPYTLEELSKIFQHAPEELYPLFMIGLFSGLRLGDICKLKKSDVAFDRHFIIRTQAKTSGLASIPMHQVLENYLQTLFIKYPDSEYVLPELAEQHAKNASVICIKVNRFLEKDLKIKTTKQVPGKRKKVNVKGIHSLRHTFCTIAGVVGIPETVVRSIVGHMTPQMIRLYTRHIEEGEKLKYIQLFGEKLQNIPELPRIPFPELPADNTAEDEYQKKWDAVVAAGSERLRLEQLLRTLPLDEVRKLLIEMQERYPMNPTTTYTWQI